MSDQDRASPDNMNKKSGDEKSDENFLKNVNYKIISWSNIKFSALTW